jgi:Na+-transporting methylmalonyl-CoA/oxaloacetate decarboxylase gamma subunit
VPRVRGTRRDKMDKWSFGLTLMIVGIGGTFVTLAILIFAIEALKKIFPYRPEGGKAKQS